MQKLKIKRTVLLTVLTLSIIFPVVAISYVSAKKPGWTSGPVYIDDSNPLFSWKSWKTQPWLKGAGNEKNPYVIDSLSIDTSDSIYALTIQNSDVYFIITGCSFRNTGIEGERTAALLLVNTQNGVIYKNKIFGSNGGIALIGTGNNVIEENSCHGNEVGIFLEWSMYDKIIGNRCMKNINSGIMLSSSHKTIIEKNRCTENGQAGIMLVNLYEPEHSPKDNIIYANTVANNPWGICFSEADKNAVFRNNIEENDIGVVLDIGSEENTVYHNNFIENTQQIVDPQPWMNNWFHPYMLEGNFWSDYHGADEDGDGIGDWAYEYDNYPLMWEDSWDFYTAEEQEILDVFFNNVNRLGANRTVDGSQTSYVIYGVEQLFSELMEGLFFPPYSMKINDMLVENSVWYFDEAELYFEPGLMQLFYLKLPPNYLYDVKGLIPGYYYEYSVELTWFNTGTGEIENFYFITGFWLI